MDLEVKAMTKVLIKAAIPHWSKFFDTKEEMQQALQSLRFQPERHATLEGVEQVPLSEYSVDFEQGITAPRLSLNTHRPMVPTLGAKSLIPGIRQGRIVDQSLVDEGGAFVYPQQIADLGDLPRRDLEGRSKKDVLIGTTEKPKYHAGKLQGRVNPEGFMPGGFDPSQVFTIDQSPLSRYEARAQLLGGLGYLNRVAPEYHNEPAGIATRALLTAGIQPDSTANPLTAWGEPYTVDDEYFANKRKQNENAGRVITGEPMDIAFQLLKEELSRVASSPTIMRQPRKIVADQNPANLPCTICGNKILQKPCPRCGRPASLGAGVLTGEPMVIAMRLLKAKEKSKPFHGYNPNKHHRKGGLNAKGRAKAKREQGSNLKPPVTTKPSKLKPNSKKAKRRKSFCARMTGVKGPTSKKGKLTPKGASLKRWNC